MATSQRIAFFDVDETLITCKSMFGFLEHHLDTECYEQTTARLRELTAAGAPRELTNREYYRAFAGDRVADVAASGQRWFDAAGQGLFHPPMVAEFRRCQAEGVTTVLVSGSLAACLDPIATHLGADLVLCTVLESRGEVYTGEITATVIGEGKAAAVRLIMAERGADPTRCLAFGDHASDLPMLSEVGTAVVVGADPVLLAHAEHLGWRVLPAAVSLAAVSR